MWSLVPWSNQSRAIKDDKKQGEKQMMRSSQVKDKGWNMSLSATWSLMTAGWHFQCNCCDSPLRTKKSLGTHMMIKHLKTLRQQRSLKWGTRTNMVAMRVDILKFCLLLENKLDACPKQEHILWAIKTAPEKILPLIFWSVESLSSNWIKLHHNSVWLSPKWNQIRSIIGWTLTASLKREFGSNCLSQEQSP